MNAVRKPAGTKTGNTGHIAAIHILKSQLQMTQEDYRALLVTLTGEDTCKGMSDKDLQTVRSHMHKLAVSMGVAKAANGAASGAAGYARKPYTKAKPLEPMEKKVWAIWYALEAKGLVQVPPSRQARAKALRAYVERQTDASDMAFLEAEKMVKLIEAMKKWLQRGKDEAMGKATEVAR
jgi:phage gp16-like protein